MRLSGFKNAEGLTIFARFIKATDNIIAKTTIRLSKPFTESTIRKRHPMIGGYEAYIDRQRLQNGK
jgi:hypothetical protein